MSGVAAALLQLLNCLEPNYADKIVPEMSVCVGVVFVKRQFFDKSEKGVVYDLSCVNRREVPVDCASSPRTFKSDTDVTGTAMFGLCL